MFSSLSIPRILTVQFETRHIRRNATPLTMVTTSKLTIVLAPGACHTSDCFDVVRDTLHARGWSTEVVCYSSVTAEPPIKGLADEGTTIVLVRAFVRWVGWRQRCRGVGLQAAGEAGPESCVVMFVYLAAFVTPLGKSIKDMLSGQFLPWMKFDVRVQSP